MTQELNSISLKAFIFQADASGILALTAMVFVVAMLCITAMVIALKRQK